MLDIKPFDFKRLPKISRQDARLIEALQIFLPRIGFAEDLGRSIRRLVTKDLGGVFSFRQEKIATVNLSATLRTLSHQSVYLIFGMAPLEAKAILEIDPFLAHRAVDKLLGGDGEPPATIRPLTEIEEGVLSYLFLKILSNIFERCGRSARVHFRLEGLCSSPDEIFPLIPKSREGESAVMIAFRLELGDRSGYARLFLPSPFLHKVFLEPLEGAKTVAAGERDFQYYAARLENLGFLETTLWAEIGRTTLKAKEVNGLEPGDVVLLERTQARVGNGRLEGYLPIRLGKGERGAFRGEIMTSPGTPSLVRRGKGEVLRVQLHGMELEHPVGKVL